jgi:(p)ppGpp synthase/HD superfamily hydrolase
MRMGEDGKPKKILLEEPGGYMKVGHPRLRWLDNVTDGLARAGVRNWRRRNQNRELWQKTAEEAIAHLGLLSC